MEDGKTVTLGLDDALASMDSDGSSQSETETENEETETKTETEEVKTEETKTEEDESSSVETKTEETETEGAEEKGEDDEDIKIPEKEDTPIIRNLRKQQKQAKSERDLYLQSLEKIAKAQDMTVDELVEKLEDEADEKQAKEKGVSKEIQKQLRTQQEQLTKLEAERRQQDFLARAQSLAERYSLKQEDLKTFVKDAYEQGFDLMQPNVNFEAAYNAVNHETLIEQARKDERQKVYAEIERQKESSSSSVKRTGAGSDGKIKDINEALSKMEF